MAARRYGGMKTRSSGNAQRRRMAPAETQEVYLSAVTWGRAAQAAHEFGIGIDELVEAATLAHLQTVAGELFEREFYEAKQEAEQGPVSLKRYEFEKQWRKPSWAKDQGPPPSPVPE